MCLGNESSGCARRRRPGARCWLDQEPVRPGGVTHYRPAARFPCSRPAYRTLRVGGSVGMLAERTGLRGRRRHAPRRARARDRRRADGRGDRADGYGGARARLRGGAAVRGSTRSRRTCCGLSKAPATTVPGLSVTCSATASGCMRSSRTSRAERRLRGKDDQLDAVRAARSGLATERQRAAPRGGRAPGGAAAALARAAQRCRHSTRRSRPAAQRHRHRTRCPPPRAASAAAR